MKHKPKITYLLIGMFILTQIIGLYVAYSYHSTSSQGTLPSWIEPPKDVTPQTSLFSILFAILFGVVLMFILMRLRAESFFRLWFFLVVGIAIAITLNAFLAQLAIPFLIPVILAIPLAFVKVFIRDIRVHNITELMIYPGIASLFIPLLNIWTAVVLLILISIYDMYAVWHSGIMQKMAKYQISQLRVFAGFIIPYMKKGNVSLVKLSKGKAKNVKVNVAILGGGDVVFPLILSGVVLYALGIYSALLVTLGAVVGLSYLLYKSEKGKFYPAMPFITAGCLIALGIVYIINLL